MIPLLLAQFAGVTLGYFLITAILIAAVVAIAVVAFKAMGVQIPGWAATMLWIAGIAILAIFLIKLVLSM